ncbi:thiolase family protein [Georgenia sp. SYP-B2076]|uniref:thiolase family protein n=1 Tax=Georgenia sp. SYP-B2076 TaxID=2495881 RepID=UPI000F8CD244|nr:thiolase family protein [Georgenia sp. SYP-B2076]
MTDAVIVEAVRTPLGKRDGALAGIHPAQLSAHVLTALAERSGVDPVHVDDVIWGCGGQVGDQAMNVARSAVLGAGWPESVPGVTIDRQCGSSQQAVHFAAAGLVAGHYDVVVAGGVESMSRVPMGATAQGGVPYGPLVEKRYPGLPFNQGISAQKVADRWGVSRSAMDEYSVRSHQRARAATDAGLFAGEIAPIVNPDGIEVTRDEGIRPESTVEILGRLRSAYREGDDITAANSSQVTDGSSALLMMTSAKAEELGVRPLARVHTAVVVGDDPEMMLSAPIPATRKALAKAGLSLEDIGAFEINEAYASVVLAWLREIGADEGLVNTLGGAVAIGHPIGGSGTRLMTTLVHHMQRENIRYGLQSMCEGGGLANATILERL